MVCSSRKILNTPPANTHAVYNNNTKQVHLIPFQKSAVQVSNGTARNIGLVVCKRCLYRLQSLRVSRTNFRPPRNVVHAHSRTVRGYKF